MNRLNWQRRCLQALFAMYLLVVAYLCFTPRFPVAVQFGSYPPLTSLMVGRAQVVYVPFQEIETLGFWLNVLMTVPFGGFLRLLLRKPFTWRAVLLTGLLVGLGIETGQFILDNLFQFNRTVDINDVISNLSGVVFGYYFVHLAGRRWLWQR